MAHPHRPPGGDHYFTTDPAAPHDRRVVPLDLPDGSVRLTTDAGVFAGDRVDAGTKLLLLEGGVPDPSTTGALLDLGCGYGAIAVTLARRAPRATVWAVDVNQRALDLCAENAAATGAADRVRAVAPDDVPDDVVFEGIWSNPPIRIGKAALHELLERWLPRLAPGGVAWLVVARNLGADSLAGWLTGRGHRVERTTSRAGYRVLRVDRGRDLDDLGAAT